MSRVKALTHRKVKDISFPGGKSRKSVRVHFADGSTAIATQRQSSRRAKHEISVMEALTGEGARVPRILGLSDGLMVQEDLGTTRLSQALHAAREDQVAVEQLLQEGITSLADIHDAAARSGLADKAPLIGSESQWIEGLIRCPEEIGAHLERAPAGYDVERLIDFLRIREPKFVKWDARPGNALITGDQSAYWFDWEDSGARNAIDDLIWLMADEFVTHQPEIEDRLLAIGLDRFSGDPMRGDEAREYLHVMGVFHTAVRIGLVISNKDDGDWWSMTSCLSGDKVGVTLRCARRLVWRGAAWAEKSDLTRPLVSWFQTLEDLFEAA